MRAALAWIPNADLDYDSWVRIGMAIKGAIGEAGAELFAAWSAQSAKNDPAVTAKTWAGFKPKRIGAGTLYHHAIERGWKPDAALVLDGSAPRDAVHPAAGLLAKVQSDPDAPMPARPQLVLPPQPRSTVSMACSASWSSISWRPQYVPSHGSRWARRSRCWAR